MTFSICDCPDWTNTPQKITTKKDIIYGTRPSSGDRCGIEPNCSPYDRPPISLWHGHKAFYTKQTSK